MRVAYKNGGARERYALENGNKSILFFADISASNSHIQRGKHIRMQTVPLMIR